jgi:hypothetical protein
MCLPEYLERSGGPGHALHPRGCCPPPSANTHRCIPCYHSSTVHTQACSLVQGRIRRINLVGILDLVNLRGHRIRLFLHVRQLPRLGATRRLRISSE